MNLLPFIYPNRRRSIPPNYKTPPYVTAEPEIIHYKRDKNDEFMVLACDGLWDELESKDAVNIVSGLVKEKENKCDNYATALITAALSHSKDHKTIRMDRIQHHFSIPAPTCRRHRDDMTVNVVFFEPIVEKKEKAFELMQVPTFQVPTAPQLEKWAKAVGNRSYPKL